MPTQTLKQNFEEVQEITILENGQLITSLDKLVGSERLLSVAHNFNVPLFFDYKISVDGGTTFWSPEQILTVSSGEYFRMFTSDGFLYFDYYGGGTSSQCIWKYRLYVIEAKA